MVALRHLPLAQLRAFEAVARLRSFAAAARELQVAVPSVSRHVKKLEEMLGVQLIERAHASSTPTAAGKLLLIDVHFALERMAETIDVVRAKYGRTAAYRREGDAACRERARLRSHRRPDWTV
jgi:DNA-binding transcriptional LysR family regulator